MRETSKTITFSDFNFTYSRGGAFDEVNSITVCEPGFDKRTVHARMSVLVGDAQVKASKRFSDMNANADVDGDAAPEASDADVAENGAEPDFLLACRMGMLPDEYARFLDYIQKELTNCKALAYVGSNPDERFPITDGVWMSIAQEGGLDAGVNRILGAFASFFSLVAVRSTKASGSEPSSSSEVSAVGSSPTKGRARSPGRN